VEFVGFSVEKSVRVSFSKVSVFVVKANVKTCHCVKKEEKTTAPTYHDDSTSPDALLFLRGDNLGLMID